MGKGWQRCPCKLLVTGLFRSPPTPNPKEGVLLTWEHGEGYGGEYGGRPGGGHGHLRGGPLCPGLNVDFVGVLTSTMKTKDMVMGGLIVAIIAYLVYSHKKT